MPTNNYNQGDVGDLSYLTSNLLTTGEATINRDLVGSARSLATQALHIVYFTARKTELVSQIRIASVGAAGATPSLVRIGWWTANAAGALLASVATTVSDTALLAGATTMYTKAFSASAMKIAGQRYAVGVLVVTATTAPTIAAGTWSSNVSEFGQSPRRAGFVAAQADLPATVASGSISDAANPLYAVLLP